MRVGLSMRLLVSGLLAASGLLMIAADLNIWWPTCPWGDFDTPDCLMLQSTAYTFDAPPGIVVGQVHDLVAGGQLLFGLALGLLPIVLTEGRPGWRLMAVNLVTTASWLTIVGSMWLDARGTLPPEPETLSMSWQLLVAWTYQLGWPVVLIFAAIRPYWPEGRRSPSPWWRCAFVGSLLGSTPLPNYFLALAVVGYASHDTTPYTGAVAGACLLIASITLWPASRAWPRQDPAVPPGPKDPASRVSAPSTGGCAEHVDDAHTRPGAGGIRPAR